MSVAEIIRELEAVANEHTDEEDGISGSRYLAERMGLDLDELEDVAYPYGKRAAKVVLEAYGGLLQANVFVATLAAVWVEGFLAGAEVERRRDG